MLVRVVLRLLLPLVLCAVTSTHAQIFRAYLASDGNDANPCTLPQPCRLLPAALAAVATGGEIWMLDSANYNTGTVTITNSVSILAIPGAVGSVVAVNGGPAISIPSGSPEVALRNIVIGPVAGATPGTHGVHMTTPGKLVIENCLIANLLGNVGVFVEGLGTLAIIDTTFRNNDGTAIGLRNGPRASISSTKILNSISAVTADNLVDALTTVVISDSVISRASNLGVSAINQVNFGQVRITVTRTTIERANKALNVLDTAASLGIAQITVGGSTISENVQPWVIGGPGGTILSLGNNQIGSNTGVPSGSLTSLPPQ